MLSHIQTQQQQERTRITETDKRNIASLTYLRKSMIKIRIRTIHVHPASMTTPIRTVTNSIQSGHISADLIEKHIKVTTMKKQY